jgi:hypothetical protein
MNDAAPEIKLAALGGKVIRQPLMFGRLRVLTMDDIGDVSDRDYLLKGLISPAEMSVWWGPPKCGKSFLLLRVAYRIAQGKQVLGRRVKACPVLYVAAEGEAGLAGRLRAIRSELGEAPRFHLIAQPVDLLHPAGDLENLRKAADTIGAKLIALDTLARMMAGGDENGPEDMGRFIANVGALRSYTGAHVAVVHHGTKNPAGSTPRGHGSLIGAADLVVEIAKGADGNRTATVTAAKDDPDGGAMGFKLRVIEVGTDQDGDPITTCIVEEQAEPATVSQGGPSLTTNEKIAMRCFDSAFKADAIPATTGADFTERLVIRADDWRRWFYQEGKPGEDQSTKRKAFNRAKDGLLAKNRIAAENDLLWPVRAS